MREVFFAYELFPRYVGYSRNVAEYFPKGNQVLCARAPFLSSYFCFLTRCFSPVLRRECCATYLTDLGT
jgi:hypothetical protein